MTTPNTTKCGRCGKQLGNHQAQTLNCPIGKARDGTYWQFSETDCFQPAQSTVQKAKRLGEL